MVICVNSAQEEWLLQAAAGSGLGCQVTPEMTLSCVTAVWRGVCYRSAGSQADEAPQRSSIHHTV